MNRSHRCPAKHESRLHAGISEALFFGGDPIDKNRGLKRISSVHKGLSE